MNPRKNKFYKPNKYIPITPVGLELFKKEKETLIEKRKPAVVNLRTAREMGDLSENAAYKVARMELSSIDARLRRLEYIIRLSTVVEKKESGTIGFGNKIKLKSEDKEIEYTLVGGYESDPLKGKISHMSPLGTALFGRKAGDQVIVATPKGNVEYQIVAVTA